MDVNGIKDLLKMQFPALVNPSLLNELSEMSSLRTFKGQEVVVEHGDFVKWIPLVVKGAVKISRVEEKGSELFLYYLYAGSTCAMTLNCCMADKPAEIRAVAEEGTELILIPKAKLQNLMLQFDDWRKFMIESFNDRYENLLHTIDAIAFHKLDERLWEYLEDKSIASGTEILNITHQKISEDLNSSREVISRLLKQLEKLDKLKLGRNTITIL